MKIFVYEHVTGGGMIDAALPESLLLEADLMVRTLLDDLATCPGIELLTTRDARLEPFAGIQTVRVRSGDDPFVLFGHGVESSDATWPTAPETGGVLERLARTVISTQRILLGSRPDAVQVAASKLATSRTLRAAGIPAVETFAAPGALPPRAGRWITKPDDGAGAEGAQLAPDWRTARARLAASHGLVAQPWIEGDALSLSLLCAGEEAALLSCNRQILRVDGERLTLSGIDVNAVHDDTGDFARLGRAIARALPGLWGYVGVDLILTGRGPEVLEINPRLTTSWCGLRAARGISVGAEVLALLEPAARPRWQSADRGTTVHLGLAAVRE